MFEKIELINPTLEKNIPLVIELVRTKHGEMPGSLDPYEIYIINLPTGGQKYYSLPFAVFQFIATPEASPETPRVCIDIVEPSIETEGGFGSIQSVVKSIIFEEGQAVFNTKGSYLIKRVNIDPDEPFDKPGKPNSSTRRAKREHYLASQMPRLGVNHAMIQNEESMFFRMNRAPGFTLDKYINRLNTEEYLSLVCALLEEVPRQIHTIITRGKHQGRPFVHCDLKLENILAERQGKQWIITVIDLGLAKAMKDNGYITNNLRGNLLSLDADMLLSRRPITYDVGTDLYALFSIILTLSGATRRYELEELSDLIPYLKNPDLTGLFYMMDFDPETRGRLGTLSIRMATDDRSQRPSAQEALDEFRQALAKTASDPKPSLITEPAAEENTVSPEDLKNWVEQKLDEQIKNGTDTEQSILQEWISNWRRLCSLINEQELTHFNGMISRSLQQHTAEIKFSSRYIYNFLRLNILNEYDDTTSARLLFRHHINIEPIRKNTPLQLPELWARRFKGLVNILPLQINKEDEEYCMELGEFKKHLAFISNEEQIRHGQNLFIPLQELSKKYLEMRFEDWIDKENMYLIVYDFNQRYYFYKNVRGIIERVEQTRGLEHFLRGIERWALQLPLHPLNDELILELTNKLYICDRLGAQLVEFKHISIQYLIDMVDVFPALEQSLYNAEVLTALIDDLDISDDLQLNLLMQRLDIALVIADIYSRLNNDQFCCEKDPAIIQECTQQFSQMLTEHINEPDILKKAKEIQYYLDALDDLHKTIRELKSIAPNSHVVGVLTSLMQEKPLVLELAYFASHKIDWVFFHKLCNGLRITQEKFPAVERKSRFCAEIKKYDADPSAYDPFAATQASTASNPHRLFLEASSSTMPSSSAASSSQVALS